MSAVSGESLFGLPVSGNEGEFRVVTEHEGSAGEAMWAISRIRKDLVEAYPGRPVDAECTFTVPELVSLASLAIAGDPRIRDDKHSGRKLAAGFLMLAQKIGLTSTEEKQP